MESIVAERRQAVWAHERSEPQHRRVSEGAFSHAQLRKYAVDVKEVYISAVVQSSITMLHCAWHITPCFPYIWDSSCLSSSAFNRSNGADFPAVTQMSLSQSAWRVRQRRKGPHLLGNSSWLACGKGALTCKFFQGFSMTPRSPEFSFSPRQHFQSEHGFIDTLAK